MFVLKALAHATFERSGNDLLTHVTITLSEALLGFSRILLKHLDGRGIKVSSPPRRIIKPETCIIIRGEGMPVYKSPSQKGDLYVIISVEMPDEAWLSKVNNQVKINELDFILICGFMLPSSRHWHHCYRQRSENPNHTQRLSM